MEVYQKWHYKMPSKRYCTACVHTWKGTLPVTQLSGPSEPVNQAPHTVLAAAPAMLGIVPMCRYLPAYAKTCLPCDYVLSLNVILPGSSYQCKRACTSSC